jgi:guanosine-3',5'-bis(diphosphate) 3'-pyrophosphohydrolase
MKILITMDEEEAYDLRDSASYEDALLSAKTRVREDIFHSWIGGCELEKLFEQYTFWGSEPVILSDDPHEMSGRHFFAWTYAQNIINELKAYLQDESDIQTIYQETLLFAAERHTRKGQTLPDSNIPYVVHLSNVCMEILIAERSMENFNLKLAVQAALLHDVLEDTETTDAELEERFGALVAFCAQGLTKDKRLPKAEQMADSLQRIKRCPKEIWAVKLADRITNMQKPPSSWPPERILRYHEEAQQILKELKDGSEYLRKRLGKEIEKYSRYLP